MNDNFEENDYGFNNFKDNSDDISNELNASESKLVDIRIILTGIDYLEFLSKAVSNFDLSNFNVKISSIIPTKDIETSKNTIIGADLVLIATEPNAEGHKLYQNLKKSLKTEFNFIEYLKLPSFDELDDYEYDDYNNDNLFEDEIANSIIREGLYSISNLSSINHSKRKYHDLKKDFDEELLKSDKITKENEFLIKESKSFRERNEKLFEELKVLQRELDKIKSDYSDLKSRFEGIHSKNSLEVFSLNDLWYDLFGEYLSEEIYKFILISTDNFRPKNLMIGQGAICAQSKEDALDWLKIIKTAFILSDTNKQDLDYNNFNSNFKFDDIEEFGMSPAYEESKSFDNLDFAESRTSNDSIFKKSIFENDVNIKEEDVFNSQVEDDFIYNARFEGNSRRENNFINEKFVDEEDFIDGKSNEINSDEINNKEKINVFNLKSIKSIEDEEDNDNSNFDEEISGHNADNEDYDYDEEDSDEGEDEEIYSAFSNLWD